MRKTTLFAVLLSLLLGQAPLHATLVIGNSLKQNYEEDYPVEQCVDVHGRPVDLSRPGQFRVLEHCHYRITGLERGLVPMGTTDSPCALRTQCVAGVECLQQVESSVTPYVIPELDFILHNASDAEPQDPMYGDLLSVNEYYITVRYKGRRSSEQYDLDRRLSIQHEDGYIQKINVGETFTLNRCYITPRDRDVSFDDGIRCHKDFGDYQGSSYGQPGKWPYELIMPMVNNFGYSVSTPSCQLVSYGSEVGLKDDSLQAYINWTALAALRDAERRSRQYAMQGPTSAQTMMAGQSYKWAALAAKNYATAELNREYDRNLYSTVSDCNLDMIVRHAPYCSPEGAEVGLCPEDMSLVSKKLVDYSAANFFAPFTLAEVAVPAARLYVSNISNPCPIRMMPPDVMYEDGVIGGTLSEKGAEHWAGKMMQTQQLSYPQYLFMNMMARRIPQEDLAPRAGIPVPTEAVDDGGYGLVPKNVSIAELEQYEALKRFTSPEWYTSMNAASQHALLREIANMMAFQLNTKFDRLMHFQNLEMLLSIQMASNANYQAGAQSAKEHGVELADPTSAAYGEAMSDAGVSESDLTSQAGSLDESALDDELSDDSGYDGSQPPDY